MLSWQFHILGMHMILILAFLKELLLLGKQRRQAEWGAAETEAASFDLLTKFEGGVSQPL